MKSNLVTKTSKHFRPDDIFYKKVLIFASLVIDVANTVCAFGIYDKVSIMRKFLMIAIAALAMVGCVATTKNISVTESENVAERLVTKINDYTEQINAVETVYDLFFISEKCYKEKMSFEKDNADEISAYRDALEGAAQTTYDDAVKKAMDEFEAAVNRKAKVLADEQNASGETKKQETVFYDLTLEEALVKAKAEGKYVLVDFYTKTCGPCRKMERDVFPKAECGEYINKRFVTIKIDGEDNGVGTEIAKKYQVFIYPTYMVLSANSFKEGEVQGAEYDVNKFLGMLKEIIHDK